MRDGRHLVAEAHVRPEVIVEMDIAAYYVPGLLRRIEKPPVDAFGLDDAIDTLGHGVVRGLVVLCHAD